MDGKEIKSLRHRLGWSQVRLASWVGLKGGAVQVSRWENNKNSPQGPTERLLSILTVMSSNNGSYEDHEVQSSIGDSQ